MPTKVHIVKAMIFPAVTYRCESWATKKKKKKKKKTEHKRIDAFKL